jgi:hypothetical protein
VVLIAILALAIAFYRNDSLQDTTIAVAGVTNVPVDTQATAQVVSSAVQDGVLSLQQGAQGLSGPLLDAVLGHIARGEFIKDSPEFQRFLDMGVQDHRAALALLDEKFRSIPPYETTARGQLFAVLLELGIAMKARQMPSDDLIRDAQPLIHKQLAEAGRVLLPRQDFTREQIDAMLHRGDFNYVDNQMYATTLRAKYMAMALLIETGSSSARAAMEAIAGSDSLDSTVRDIARDHLRRPIWR